MARASGTIIHEDGFTSGWVGDLPIEEAIRVVREGRLRLDYSVSPLLGMNVPDVLAGLEVEGLGELFRLVRLGRLANVPVVHDAIAFGRDRGPAGDRAHDALLGYLVRRGETGSGSAPDAWVVAAAELLADLDVAFGKDWPPFETVIALARTELPDVSRRRTFAAAVLLAAAAASAASAAVKQWITVRPNDRVRAPGGLVCAAVSDGLGCSIRGGKLTVALVDGGSRAVALITRDGRVVARRTVRR